MYICRFNNNPDKLSAMKSNQKLRKRIEFDYKNKLCIIPFSHNIIANPNGPQTTGNINTPEGYVMNQNLYLTTIQQSSEVDGFVYLHTSLYLRIFDRAKKKSSDKRKRLSIVRITADNGKKIYREFHGISIKDYNNHHIALTHNSLHLLNDTTDGNSVIEPTVLTLSNGNRFPLYSLPFYWNHPDKAIRVSFKLGALSFFLGIVSFLLGCLSLYITLIT